MAEIGRAAVLVEADTQGLDAGMKAAAAAVESSTARMNRAVATTSRIGDRFDAVEGRVKGIGRAFNDARGTLELFGQAGGGVAASLLPIAGAVGGVADAFGSLSTVFRGGAGLGIGSIVPILSAVVVAATAAYGAYKLLSGGTEDAAKAQKELDDAMAFAESRMRTATEQALELEFAKRKQALATLEAAKATQEETAAQLAADREFAAAALAEAQNQGSRPVRRGTLRQGAAQQAATGLAEDILQIDRALAAVQESLARTEGAIAAVAAPSAESRLGIGTAAAGARQEVDALNAALEKLRQQQEDAAARDAQNLFDATRTAAERYAAELERIARLQEQLQTLFGDETAAEVASRAEEAAKRQFESAERGADSAGRAYARFGDIASSAFEDVIFKTTKASDVVKAFANDIAKLIIRSSITGPLSEAVTPLLGGIGKEFGTALGGLFRAAGGPVSANQPYIVGEQGPEWFVPANGGTILPNGVAPGMAAASQPLIINQNIDARGSSISRAELAAAAEAGAQRGVAMVADRTRRGGSYRAAVQGA
jgi:hypothetical protein